jgi:hypothetical protein
MTSVRWLLADHPLPSQALGAVSWHQQRFFSMTAAIRFSVRFRVRKRPIWKKPEQNGGEQRDD